MNAAANIVIVRILLLALGRFVTKKIPALARFNIPIAVTGGLICSAVIAVLDEGEHFGEMAPLFRIPRSAAARAKGETHLTGYTTEQFREHIGVASLTELIPTASTPIVQ